MSRHLMDQALRASREGRAFILKASQATTLSGGVVQTAAGTFKAIPVGKAAVVAGFMMHLHTVSDTFQLEIGYTSNADGTGDFVATSPEIMIHTGDKHTGVPPEFVALPVPMYIAYSATSKAVAVKLTCNDDAATVNFGVAGWLEDEGTLSEVPLQARSECDP